MKLGKYNLNRHTASSLYHRHIRPIWDPRLRENSEWQKRFLIITNNFCNMGCYSCSALCNRPIGSNPFRWKKHITPIEDISKFLKLIEGYRPKYWIRLSGGEVTLCPPEYVKEICELSHQHGRPISLLTNGAKIKDFNPHWFDFIHLDEHTANEKNIYEVARHFKEINYPHFQILTTKIHRDLELQRTNNVTKGLQCDAWLQAVSLWRETIYPCCVIPFLDGWNNDTKIRESLQEYGWSIHNPNLVQTMGNYRQTTPPQVAYACQLQCWKDGPNVKYNPV